MKKLIQVNDFNMFYDVMKSTVKIVESAKISIDQTGLSIYGAHKPIARCAITSNAVTANDKVEFCVLDLQMFVKILGTIKDVHDNDYSEFKMFLDDSTGDKISFESKKFKSKFQTQKEDIIAQWISQAITAQMKPVFEFTTTSDLIRRVRNHQFIFSDPTTMRIYLETKADMENNTLYATIGNKQTTLNNEMTLKFGLVTNGTLKDNIILDVDRLNLLDAMQSDQIKVSLMDMNVLIGNIKVTGKNDTYMNITILESLLKA